MKFTINGTNLKTELECVSHVIDKKQTIPVLENVLIRSMHGRLTLTGTNLDQTIEAPVEALAICESARQNGTTVDHNAAKIIYTNIFGRDESHYRDWNTASYQAPETHEGFAFHLCIYTAIQIRNAKEQTNDAT